MAEKLAIFGGCCSTNPDYKRYNPVLSGLKPVEIKKKIILLFVSSTKTNL